MRRALLVSLLLLLPISLGAQSPADRATLARADAAIPPGILPDIGDAGDAVARQLQRALGNFALYIRNDDRRAGEKALFDFDQAALRRKQWAWPDYGMARVFLAFHERDAPAILSDGKIDGETNIAAVWRHLYQAMDRDSTLTVARDLLVNLAYLGSDRELTQHARDAIARVVQQADAPRRAWLVYGRALRTELSYDSAQVAFDAARAAGADRSVVGLELARTLMALGDSAGAVAAYWDGAAHLSNDGRAVYHQDLEWIVGADSLRSFDSTSNTSATAWLRRFWAERDAAAMHSQDGRLEEHLRRWVVAHREYRLPWPEKRTLYTRFWRIAGGAACVASASAFMDSLPVHPPTLDGDVRFREPLLDHRGFIYMRHGDPVVRTGVATFDDPELDAVARSSVNLSTWVYWIEGAYRGFHFQGSETFGAHAPTTLVSYLPFNFGAWMALASFLPEYQSAALILDPDRRSIGPRACLAAMQVAIRTQRSDASVAMTTDSDVPLITRPWNAPLQFFALGTAAAGNGRALVTFALPLRNLTALPLDNARNGYSISFRMVAFDTRSGRTITVDTVRRFRATRTAGAESHLTGWFEIPLDEGSWQVAVRAQQHDSLAGAYSMRRGLVVDAGGALALSDIVTGREGSPDRWLASGEPFPLNVLGSWPRGSAVELYYEVRGLTAGQPYSSTLQVFATDPRQGEQISVRTPDVATGPLSAVRRSLALGTLAPGRYRLVVTVEAGGQSAAREQGVVIR